MTHINIKPGDPVDLALALIADDALPIGSTVRDERRWEYQRYPKGWQHPVGYSYMGQLYPSLVDLVQAEGQVTVSFIARRPR